MTDKTPTPDTRPNLDALIEQGRNMATLDRYELVGWRVEVVSALAAERERADALALLIEQAPHTRLCPVLDSAAPVVDGCTCWKSTAPSAALVAARDAEVLDAAAEAIAAQRDDSNPDPTPDAGWSVADHSDGRFLGKTVAIRLLRARAAAIRKGRS
jgi:hypothetical protein